MVHNDEQPFNVPHVNCGLRTFGIHACVAKFSYKPSRPLRGLNYRRDAFSIAYLRVNIFKIVPMLLAKRKLLRRGLEEDRGRMCSQTLSSSHRLLLSSQPNLRFNNPLLLDPTHRRMAVNCHLPTTSLFQTILDKERGVIGPANLLLSFLVLAVHYCRQVIR